MSRWVDAQLRQEETRLARLYATGKLSEEVYDQLRAEWQEKALQADNRLANLEREVGNYLDDLDAALVLLTRVEVLYERLGEKQRRTLLQNPGEADYRRRQRGEH